MRRYLLGFILLACGGPDATGMPAFPEDAFPSWCDTHRCEYAGVRVYSPEDELETMTEMSANRWAASTGLELHIAGGGIPVYYEEDLQGPDATHPNYPNSPLVPYCGVSHQSYGPFGELQVDWIKMDPTPPEGCVSDHQIMLHEMGHTLPQPFSNEVHTKRGIMSNHAYENGLDDESITMICSSAPCTKFQPERYLAVQ